MSALGRFERFTLFSPRVSPSKHLPCSFFFVLCFGFGVFVALSCFCFLFCKCFGIPNSRRSLDLDDLQGLIASSAMQQKKRSDAFPPKSSAAARSRIDEAMGPWLCPQEGDVLLLAHLTVHMDPECLLITRRTYPLRMCYCVTKLHRCFHCDVDSGFVLHSNCRCSENVDVATDKFWPVVTMCRRPPVLPFP